MTTRERRSLAVMFLLPARPISAMSTNLCHHHFESTLHSRFTADFNQVGVENLVARALPHWSAILGAFRQVQNLNPILALSPAARSFGFKSVFGRDGCKQRVNGELQYNIFAVQRITMGVVRFVVDCHVTTAVKI